MTLAELIIKATGVGNRFNTAWIPLKYNGKDIDINFTSEESNESPRYIINMTIKQNE